MRPGPVRSLPAFLVCAILLFSAPGRRVPASGYTHWSVYGGGPDGIRYSALKQIDRNNVAKLRVAWTFDTGDAFKGSEMQCNPIVIEGVLYATTPKGRVIALNAATGKLQWSYNPFEGREVTSRVRTRGLVYAGGRLYVPARQYIYALDARTGKPAATFGDGGRIDLREGLGREAQSLTVLVNTPGVVYKDLLITGSLVSEGLPSAPGDIRAYDLRTGKQRWAFHTIPHPGEFGHDTWPEDAWKYSGGANSWPGLALDEQRGLVFVPTGSAAFDFYGANRAGDNLFANSVIALKADTGERVWHFQVVKHDVWDRDLPAPPSLVTVRRGGQLIDGVAQITKSGHVFVFERASGKPLFPVEYRAAPASDVDGESLAAMQPLPVKPAPFARQVLTEAMLTKRTPEAHRAVLETFRKVRSDGQFAPPSREGTVVFPGFDGGGEWGGAAFDPETGLFYVNSNEMAWILRLVERSKKAPRSGAALYQQNCASCHRADLRGTPPEFPSLLRIGERRTESQVRDVIEKGSGRMPGFARLGTNAMAAITRFVLRGEDTAVAAQAAAPSPIDLKYTHDGYNKFLDPDGYPAVEPPWGTLNAINLDTGEYAWRIPFGEFPELAALGMRNTGTENYGGPVVTAGGLLFIGATNHDRKFRAFDKLTGKLLWETTLPASGNATPAVYEAKGRQYVVIGAGGGKSGAPSGGSYVAFALPEK
jgi:quinoprotein glucose dehydrogenase